MGVLALIGADKTGSSDSNTIEFYGASSDYTTAGTYNVEVTIAGGVITGARIKLESESDLARRRLQREHRHGRQRVQRYDNEPINPENGLQLSVDLSQDGTFTATVRVKQGFTGAMEDALERILKATSGTLALDQNQVDDQIEHLQDQIDTEEDRLTRREERLVAKYARLEKTLTLLQNQMAALGFSQ